MNKLNERGFVSSLKQTIHCKNVFKISISRMTYQIDKFDDLSVK